MSSLSAAISCTYPLRRSLHAPPSGTLQKDAFWCHQKKNKKRLSVACALPFDISPPPIDLDPLETIIDPEAEALGDVTADTYGNDDEAVDAVDNGVAVVDLSDYGRIRVLNIMFFFRSMLISDEVSGEDRIQFLHNQTTANFECLDEGQGCDTVFVTHRARTIDISCWVMKNAIVLVVSPMTCGSIIEMLKKYIFFADKVEIQDITKQTSMFALLGPKSSKVGGMPLTVAVGSITSVEGFTFMMSPAAAGSVWKALLGQGALPIGSSTWETLRILRGRPAPGKELTDEFNVLEAGLWRAVSLNKVEPGSIITIDGKKVGKLTSFTAGTKSSGPFGLGYIKRRAASDSNSVTVGDSINGTLVEVPFLREQLPPPKP
ncbi:UNVERIFIED_CONTAM: putative transferase, chloroplastic [Sesamum radiatum]|uniref:Transferase, chloroplastic n=1 Tax=Sesamum radiatum TaxID=300843 RepID=A0AAW2RWU5_SESRA